MTTFDFADATCLPDVDPPLSQVEIEQFAPYLPDPDDADAASLDSVIWRRAVELAVVDFLRDLEVPEAERTRFEFELMIRGLYAAVADLRYAHGSLAAAKHQVGNFIHGWFTAWNLCGHDW